MLNSVILLSPTMLPSLVFTYTSNLTVQHKRRRTHDRVVDVRGDRLDSSRMFPPTTVVRYSVLDVCWSPTRLDPLFKTYQGTAHAVPASAEAAHPARGRADTEQHGLLSIFDSRPPTIPVSSFGVTVTKQYTKFSYSFFF